MVLRALLKFVDAMLSFGRRRVANDPARAAEIDEAIADVRKERSTLE